MVLGTKIFGAVAGLLLFVLGVVGFADAARQLPYRAGWRGTPGTVTAITCETHGSGHNRSTTCGGVYSSSDGSTRVADAILDGDTAFPLTAHLAARLHEDGRMVSVVGTKTLAYLACGMLGTLIPIELVGGYAAIALVRLVRTRHGPAWHPPATVVALPLWTAAGTLAALVLAAIIGVSAD